MVFSKRDKFFIIFCFIGLIITSLIFIHLVIINSEFHCKSTYLSTNSCRQNSFSYMSIKIENINNADILLNFDNIANITFKNISSPYIYRFPINIFNLDRDNSFIIKLYFNDKLLDQIIIELYHRMILDI